MQLKILHDSGEISTYPIIKEQVRDTKLKNKVGLINTTSKEQTALAVINAYYSDAKAILYDTTNTLIEKKLTKLNINSLNCGSHKSTAFDDKPFSMMFFTSGTTGESIGALKTKDNLEEEVKVLSALLQEYKIKRVIVTVPFVHIYGMLLGLLYPLLNEIDIILKEHFLPNDLLNVIEDNSLIVTTPLYIKALNKISKQADLSKSIFTSSTAPLDANSAKEFSQKFYTKVFQLFGSTETGGIAYKVNDESFWTPLKNVKISTNEQSELIVKSPYISNLLFTNDFETTEHMIQTFDYVNIKQHTFELIGRSSQIFKASGKRYSTIQIEEVLESYYEITKAVVFVKNMKDSLKDEVLDITLEATRTFSPKEVKKILKQNLSNLKFDIDLKMVDKIEVSNVGKKRRVLA